MHSEKGIREPTEIVFPFQEEPLYLFDSAYRGSDVLEGLTNDHAVIDLPSGNYAVATTFCCPDELTSLLLHRLSLVGSVTEKNRKGENTTLIGA